MTSVRDLVKVNKICFMLGQHQHWLVRAGTILTGVLAGGLTEGGVLVSAVDAVVDAVTQRVHVEAVGAGHVRVVVGAAVVVVVRAFH